jgi:hypothetical protein
MEENMMSSEKSEGLRQVDSEIANKLKRLEQVNSERVDKRKRLEEKLRQCPPYPQARDIWVFAPPKTMGLQWVILAQDEKKPGFLLTVPADANPMVGSADVELPKSALCSPLTLRCQYSVSIHKTNFDINGRVGILEKWHWYRALDKIKQIYKGKLRSSVLQQETDHDPDYKEWMGQVSNGRKVLLRYFRRRAFYNKLKERVKDFILRCKEHKVMAISAAVPAVFVLAVILYIYIFLPPKGLIDISYDKVIASTNSSVLQTVLQSSWKDVTPNIILLRFSEPSHSFSSAMQAFSAGLWKGKQDLLPSSPTPTDENWLKKDWSQTEWASYFKLGRWTVLLESVCQSIPQYEVPKGFWNEQQQIFDQLNKAFLERRGINDETEETDVEWVLSRFEEYIGPLLKQLPNEPQLYANLAEELKLMREGLVPQ